MPVLLQKTLSNITEERGDDYAFLDQTHWKWIEHVWEYLPKAIESLERVPHIPILPVSDSNDSLIQLKCLNGNFIAKKLHDLTDLPSCVDAVLTAVGVTVIRFIPECVQRANAIGKYIHYPTLEGVIHVLDRLSHDLKPSSVATAINDNCSAKDRQGFGTFMSRCENLPNSLDFLKYTKMFVKKTNEGGQTSELCCLTEIRKVEQILEKLNQRSTSLFQ